MHAVCKQQPSLAASVKIFQRYAPVFFTVLAANGAQVGVVATAC